ncbi:MAG: hypothetical protein ACHBN1_06830 [Heteroscytonema crispum UTEX LB 1556]
MHLDEAKLKWFRRQLQAWAKLNSRQFPWRNTKDPYAILVAVSVLAEAPLTEITRILQPLGLSFRAERLY